MQNYKEITINSYNKEVSFHAKKFKRLMELERREEFQKFISLLGDKEKMLDLGCGPGTHSLFFKQKGFEVISADLSEEMIRVCKESGLTTVLADIEDLKFQENSFDGVWAVTSLLHVPKAKMLEVAQDLSKILKPGGILYVCVKEGDGEVLVKDKVGDSQRFFAFWSEDEMREFFKNHFELIELEKVQVEDKKFLQAFFRNS